MRNVILALSLLSSTSSFGAPLVIEPSLAFSEAVTVAAEQARLRSDAKNPRVAPTISVVRRKNIAGQVGDFTVSLEISRTRGPGLQCEVNMFIMRDSLRKRGPEDVILETDEEAAQQTIARIARVSCG